MLQYTDIHQRIPKLEYLANEIRRNLFPFDEEHESVCQFNSMLEEGPDFVFL